ncbi:hypothetical protein TcasGA2_TC014833 [Tribolium castaneum]|uniref:Uncharacterized protein n=1 Tax=Tribolium castaneum TaxID=7070 RepID=D2A4F6_TRICA|nr:hypothetical protein TcasGA2_TC014833 [Tribolium castaneum]
MKVESCQKKKENWCDFAKTVVRGQDGTYTVTIPFKIDEEVNRSRAAARRLAKGVKLDKDYEEFMNEYLQLGHMTNVLKLEGQDSIPEELLDINTLDSRRKNDTKKSLGIYLAPVDDVY